MIGCEYEALDYPMYLTGVSTERTRNARRDDLGLLVTPASSVHRQIDHYSCYAADNGCFAETDEKPFDEHRWLAWLAELQQPERCLFAVLPDVVGDAVKTFHRSMQYVDLVDELDLPVAWVAQDGLEERPHLLDQMLDEADCIFIGGSTDWKLSEHAARVARIALDAEKWVHVGRVNSLKRLRFAAAIGAHSVDGTYLRFGTTAQREHNIDRLFGWLDTLASTQQRAA